MTSVNFIATNHKASKVSLLIMLVMLASVALPSFLHGSAQEDVKGFYISAIAYERGVNPYLQASADCGAEPNVDRPYVYMPWTLLAFNTLTLFSLNDAANLYLTLKLVALILLIALWINIFHFQEYRAFLFLLIAFAFNGTVLADLRAGNISIFEQLLLWTAFYFYIRGKIGLFCVALILVASFKLLPIVLVLVLLTGWNKREMTFGLISILIVGGFVGLNALLWPHLFTSFLHNISGLDAQRFLGERGDLNPSTWALIHDGILYFQTRSGSPVPEGVQLGTYLVIVLGAYGASVHAFIRLRELGEVHSKLWRICLVCFLYAVTVPRFKNYSYVLLIAPSLFLFVSGSFSNVIVPLCSMLMIFTYRNLGSFGRILLPFYHVQSEYYCLIIAWVELGMCLYSICRIAHIGKDTPSVSASAFSRLDTFSGSDP